MNVIRLMPTWQKVLAVLAIILLILFVSGMIHFESSGVSAG